MNLSSPDVSNLKPITQNNLQDEILNFIHSRKSLLLSSLDPQGHPYASYAPFAIGDNCLYVLLSEIALHAINLQVNPQASVLIIEDENSANELFARLRVNYCVLANPIAVNTTEWQTGIDTLKQRLGTLIEHLSNHKDFCLFQLLPQGGRYVKGFGKAYDIGGKTLDGVNINHLRDGHIKREIA